jgi:hypothetical protein
MVRYEYLKNFVRFSEKISKDFKCFANTSFYESYLVQNLRGKNSF